MIKGLVAKKINSQPGDAHQDGSNCLVIGESNQLMNEIPLYLVLFEDFHLPVVVYGTRISIEEDKTKEIKLEENQEDYVNSIPRNLFKLYST